MTSITWARIRIGAVAVAVAAAVTALPAGSIVAQSGADSRPLRIRADTLEGLPNDALGDALGLPLLPALIFNGLYRIDDRLQAVPDLAAEPCTPSEEGRVLTCRLVDATFHDGTPLTARDVAYTFQLANATCTIPEALFCLPPELLREARAVDDRTVELRLARADASFVGDLLPNIRIASRADIEASFARLEATASRVDPAQVAAIHDALRADSLDDCSTAIAEPVRILADAGAHLADRGEFASGATGAFDPCRYAEHLDRQLSALQAYLAASGIDRVSASLPLLDLQRHPNGTGAWRVTDVRPGEGMTLEAFEGHHLGRPAIDRVEVVLAHDQAVALALLQAGELDISREIRLDMLAQIRDLPGIRLARYPSSSYYFVGYNVREGRLFAEQPLRQAMARCINKQRTVEAATADLGLAIESDILPGTWAYQPDLRTPERDVEAGRALIEEAGWTVGADGIYQRDGRRLAADLYLRGDHPARVRFADLLALQVRDCGIELTVRGVDQPTQMVPMIFQPPHLAPGSDQPFDLLLAAWGVPTDPSTWLTWHSEARTEVAGADGLNFIGYANPRVDQLLDEALATYDLRARARAYREIQDILADEQPYLFAWVETGVDVVSPDLTSTAGPLDLGSQLWWWRVEDLAFEPGVTG